MINIIKILIFILFMITTVNSEDTQVIASCYNKDSVLIITTDTKYGPAYTDTCNLLLKKGLEYILSNKDGRTIRYQVLNINKISYIKKQNTN